VTLLYDELRALAARRLGPEGRGQTLQPTALVHEAYARLVDSGATFNDRAHFFALAARTMRSVLIDHVRAKGTAKRGGDQVHVTLTGNLAAADPATLDLLALDEALHALAGLDERRAKAVELRFFAGLTNAEVGVVLGISEATVERDLKLARAWLAARLGEPT
jgi:RNA polymerase sigma factor (TIGR02999 family)